MRLPVTQVDVGMVLLDRSRGRLEVLERGTWCPPRGGEPWVEFRLRSCEDGALFLRGYRPPRQVEVDPASVSPA